MEQPLPTRSQRRAATRSAAKNGAQQPAAALTPEQTEQLRRRLQPLLMQWHLSKAMVTGFLAGIGIEDTNFSINMTTGTVTLVATPGVPPKEPAPDDQV